MDEAVGAHVKRHFDEFYEANPFLALLGVRVVSYARGYARLEMEIRREHTNVHGTVHGGVTAALADTAMGIACFTRDKGVVTLDMNISFLRALREGQTARAEGEVIHDGQRTMAAEARVYDERGTLCLKTSGTFFVVRDFCAEPAP